MTEKTTKKTVKRMTKEEQKQFDDLYQYVKVKIMGYDGKQSLSKKMTLRLKGLKVNKFIENSKIKDTADYSYETILNTFKYCLPIIKNGLNNNTFKDEEHKFNYILKIVEPKINDIYMKMKNNKKSEEKIVEIDLRDDSHVGAEYKPKENIKDKFSDLW